MRRVCALWHEEMEKDHIHWNKGNASLVGVALGLSLNNEKEYIWEKV